MMIFIIVCSLVFLSCMTARAYANYSEDIAAEIRGFLLDDDWKFDFDEDVGAFRFGASIAGNMKHINILIPVHSHSYNVYAITFVNADVDDPNVMIELAEFICRVNCGLRNGNFELDMEDGEIRFKVFVECEGQFLPSRDVIRNSIAFPIMMFEKFSPGILNVLFRGVSALDAMIECEG